MLDKLLERAKNAALKLLQALMTAGRSLGLGL